LSKTIAVLGARSQVGYRLLPLLEANNFLTLAISRTGKPNWAEESSAAQWLAASQLYTFEPTVNVLVSVGPMALAVEAVTGMTGLKQLVVVSSASIQFKTASTDRAEQKTMADLLAGEQHLEQLCKSRNVLLTIFRPTLVYGSGLDDNLCRLARWIVRFGWIPVAGKGAGLRQPIYAGDLAGLILESIERPDGKAGIFYVGGASQVSYREMLISVFRALEKNPRVVELPVPLFALLLRLYSLLRPAAGVSGDMAVRQNRDLLVDTSRTRSVFDFEPGKFSVQKEHLIPP
jgi:nucleoside-diphosphate-sugar epimerase